MQFTPLSLTPRKRLEIRLPRPKWKLAITLLCLLTLTTIGGIVADHFLKFTPLPNLKGIAGIDFSIWSGEILLMAAGFFTYRAVKKRKTKLQNPLRTTPYQKNINPEPTVKQETHSTSTPSNTMQVSNTHSTSSTTTSSCKTISNTHENDSDSDDDYDDDMTLEEQEAQKQYRRARRESIEEESYR